MSTAPSQIDDTPQPKEEDASSSNVEANDEVMKSEDATEQLHNSAKAADEETSTAAMKTDADATEEVREGNREGLSKSIEDALRLMEEVEAQEEEARERMQEEEDGWLNRDTGRQWNKQFACYSSANYHNSSGLERGDKIILPPSCLSELYGSSIGDDGTPLMFELSSMSSGEELTIPCGVLEFSASETTMLAPSWMMKNIMTKEGDIVTVKRVTLPKATFIKFKALTANFNAIFENRKNILEYELRRYIAVKKGTTLSIWHKDDEYKFEVLDVKPAESVCIQNTDVEVDFEGSDVAATTTSSSGSGIIQYGGSKKQKKEDDNSSTKSDTTTKKTFEAFGGRGELQQSGSTFFADKDQSHYSVCSNCEAQVPKESVALHEANCFRNIFRCSECGKRFKKAEKEEHMQNYHGMVKCKCGREMQKWRLELHEQEECDDREIACPFCGVAQKASSLSSHQNFCGARTEQCPDCGKFITLQDFAVHRESKCRVISNKRTLKESVLICPTCFTPFVDVNELMDHVVSCSSTAESNAAAQSVPMEVDSTTETAAGTPTTATPTTTTNPGSVQLRGSTDDIIICPYCQDPFLQFDDLEAHCKSQHSEEEH
eukprot:TRINITY_DN1825_c0_g1_i2.p1 TRINITY_DN1825_c0_g1~~TRINITY_DN1825_c0_g1_i2.p1  ORF type:complete len:603 (+),score=181.95 TRINITY_DN1825_c0_g1_i2:345-2153(+)